MTTHRYPLEPLAHRLNIHLDDDDAVQRLAEALNVHDQTIRRWRDHDIPDSHPDSIRGSRIDHLANLVGTHPMCIWPTWIHDIEPDDKDLDYTDDPPLHNITAA